MSHLKNPKNYQALTLIIALIMAWSFECTAAENSEKASTETPAVTKTSANPVAPTTPPPTPAAVNQIEKRLDTAAHLLKNGEYKRAQSLYKKILRDPNLSHSQRQKIQEGYEDLNMKMLFSKTESANSTFYTVVAGDSLYKIAKKNKTTVPLIKKTNALTKDTIYPGMKLKLIKGSFSIHVDKSENKMALKLNDGVLKHYRVATGEKNGTPTGTFKITTKLEDPTWYKTGAVVPPGSPENALGTRWLGFDHPGYGIHGTIEPSTIGKQVTEGCVRMLNRDVEEIYSIVPRGTQVTIID